MANDMRRMIGAGCMLASMAISAAARTPAPETALLQQSLFDSYQMCVTLGLPEDLRAIRDAEAAVSRAADRCRIESLALAGQYALDNPGTQDTHGFLESQRRRVVVTLSQWIFASSRGPAPHPLTPVSTGSGGKNKPTHIPRSHPPHSH